MTVLEDKTDHLAEAATALWHHTPVRSIQRIPGRGNSRVYCLDYADSLRAALKVYPPPIDQRDRLETEFTCLQLLRAAGIDNVPAPLARNRDSRLGLYQWVSGPAIMHPDQPQLRDALEFIERLKSFARRHGDRFTANASEACLSTCEIIAQIQRRLDLLRGVADSEKALKSFIERQFTPIFANMVAWSRTQVDVDAVLPKNLQTLSPSDFGFHNAILAADERVWFIDFEYFGWDDPVKLIVDFVWHPAMNLETNLAKTWVEQTSAIFQDDANLRQRLHAQYPLFGLRWCMILLNEFLPSKRAPRLFAQEHYQDKLEIIKAEKLARAQQYLNVVRTTYNDNPYCD